MSTHDVMTIYHELTELLAQEEQATPVRTLADFATRHTRRQLLAGRFKQLEDLLYALESRIQQLPKLPEQEHIDWAQAVLAFPNLAFLEVDTNGLSEKADILRIVLAQVDGTIIYDQVFKPGRPLDPKIPHLTALSPAMLEQAPTLAEHWEAVRQAFAGHYILSFNLAFDRSKLRENARMYHLPPLTFLGDCLQEHAQDYFGDYLYPKLSDLCARIGFPMPDHPHQTALDRIQGQIHLLKAMAQGYTQQPKTPPEQPQQDSDPFLPEFPEE